MYIDDRWLYEQESDVPEEMYEVPIGQGIVRREGSDLTIVASSYMTSQAVKAAPLLEERGVDVEIVDLRSIKPWDEELVLESVAKTGRLVVADGAWQTCGVAAEIVATVASKGFEHLRAPIERVCLPDVPAPMSRPLEDEYYASLGIDRLVATAEALVGQQEMA